MFVIYLMIVEIIVVLDIVCKVIVYVCFLRMVWIGFVDVFIVIIIIICCVF